MLTYQIHPNNGAAISLPIQITSKFSHSSLSYPIISPFSLRKKHLIIRVRVKHMCLLLGIIDRIEHIHHPQKPATFQPLISSVKLDSCTDTNGKTMQIHCAPHGAGSIYFLSTPLLCSDDVYYYRRGGR